MSGSLVRWFTSELTTLLGCEIQSEYAEEILGDSIENVEDSLRGLLDATDASHQKFISTLIAKMKGQDSPAHSPTVVTSSNKRDNSTAAPLSLVNMMDHLWSGATTAATPTPTAAALEPKGTTGSPAASGLKADTSLAHGKGRKQDVQQPPKADVQLSSGKRKKNVFVSVMGSEDFEKKTYKIPGRRTCECQAAKHKLVNNCLQCGRIVCEQEGAGPCHFCANLVCTEEQATLMAAGTKKGHQLREKLLSGALAGKNPEYSSAGGEKAVAHKNKLLEYDRTSASRTKVIDDESDYYFTNSQWISGQERAALQEREAEKHNERHELRRNKKMTFDFAGRRVLEEEYVVDSKKEESFAQDLLDRRKAAEAKAPSYSRVPSMTPQFVSTDEEPSKKLTKPATRPTTNTFKHSRLQDRELQEVKDAGVCLSMHQPWASLLVKGIKMHEGRTWYSSHRGRLWIAATKQEPSPSQIQTLEEFYTNRAPPEDTPSFPEHYPSACLLGCVDVMDVLSQDQYREEFPQGESESPYVFVCSNPRELPLKFPMKGDHKIFKLDAQILRSARKSVH